jgi:peroxiredoxin
MKNTNRLLIIVIMVILALSLACCIGVILMIANSSELYDWGMEQYTLKAGAPAPEFELTSLDGRTVTLSELRGKPVLVSFGATWCPPCREEAPFLQKLHETHPELTVLLINQEESPEKVQKYADGLGLSLTILLDRDGRISRRYHIYAIPSSFFIDREGILRAITIGYEGPDLIEENLSLIGVEN